MVGVIVPEVVLNPTGVPLKTEHGDASPELLCVKSAVICVEHELLGHNVVGNILTVKYGI
jgi:hypothetical protein